MEYIKATKEAFADIGIIINTERAINGEYIKHVELLTSEQLDALDARFTRISEIPIQEGEQ